MIAKRIIFQGRVQGVGFRYAVKDLARGFEVCGWVKNLSDGTVELQIMGSEYELESFVREITEESNVAHHIKSWMTESISPTENCTNFQIQ